MISLNVRRSIRNLGSQIRTARLRRRYAQKDLASLMGVSIGTIQRIEAGEPGISIGNIAMALLCLGCLDNIKLLIKDSDDDIGLFVDRQHLPQRVREKKKPDDLTLRNKDGKEIRPHRTESGVLAW